MKSSAAARMSGTNNNRLGCLYLKQLLRCACCMLFGTKRDYTVLFSPSLSIICSRLATGRLPSFMCFRLDSPFRQILRILSWERCTDLIYNSLHFYGPQESFVQIQPCEWSNYLHRFMTSKPTHAVFTAVKIPHPHPTTETVYFNQS